MIVIFNSDGSVNDTEFSDYVQQGSNGANMLQVAYADSNRDGLSAYLIAERPNSSVITLPAHRASFSCNGERYEGWEVTITGSFTLYAGTVHCTLNVVDEDENVQANYPFDVNVNATGNPIDANWDDKINVAQYNEYMAQLSGKAIIKRAASLSDLPLPGQMNAIFIVGEGISYDAYAWDPDSEGYRKLVNGICALSDISQADLSGYGTGQLFYDGATDAYYQKKATPPYYELAVSGKGILGSSKLICRFANNTTMSNAYTLFGKKKIFVFNYNNKDYLYCVDWISGYDYKAYAFDIVTRKTYMNENANATDNLSTILSPTYEADLDLGAKSVLAGAFKVGDIYHTIELISDDMVIGSGRGDIWLQPNGTSKYITSRGEGDAYKTEQYEIANADFVLDQCQDIFNMPTLDETALAYASRPNAVLKFDNTIYRYAYADSDFIYYRCANDEHSTNLSGYDTYTLNSIIRINKSSGLVDRGQISFDFYNKAQSEGKFATNFTASLNTTTYVLTFTLKNANGVALATQTIDLPLESIVTSMLYYDTYTYGGTTYHNVLVIVLATTSVPTIVPVGSLINGLEHEATIEVEDLETDLTNDQLALAEYPNARIKYGYDYYLKTNDNGTTITFTLPALSVTEVSGHTELARKSIAVTKSSGAMELTEATSNFYSKGQTDALLNSKADASNVYSKTDADDKFRTEAQVDSQIDTKLSGIDRINYIQDMVNSKNYDYKYVLRSDEELVIRLTEVE